MSSSEGIDRRSEMCDSDQEAGARPLEAYYRQPKLWDIARYESDPDQRLRARIIASLIDPQVRSVLDVGCGNGFITRHLRAEGRRVLGLDPSPEALAQFDGQCVHGRSEDLPFEDRSFDVVVCTEVLEHLADDIFTRTVEELARVAKESLVIGVPYRQDLRDGLTRCTACGTVYHTDLHQRTFNSPTDLLKRFPGFVQNALALIGTRLEMRSRLFRALRYRIVGPWGGSDYARCPHCGQAEATTDAGIRRMGLRRWFFEGVAWRMSRQEVPNWMIVHLRRTGVSHDA